MTEIDINIYSLNCNGLNDDVKRKAVFEKLKKKGDGIFMLQETHCTTENEQKWRREWGNHMYFSNGTSNARGVAIIITGNYEYRVLRLERDNEGRFLILEIERKGAVYTIGNIYAPTRNFERDQQQCFNNFTAKLELMQNIHTILGGDLNLYMNPRLDKLDNSPDYNDNRNFRADVCSFVETNNIVDVWRTINPDKRCFTWHRSDKRSRLDYLLTSEHLLNFIDDVDILPGIQSDHSLLKLSLKTGNKHEKGRGFWKFNSSLLHDPVYVDKIKNVIRETAQNYEGLEDKRMLWEIIKLEIRTQTIPYCVMKKRQKEKTERDLNKKFTTLFEKVNSGARIEKETWQEFSQVKLQLDNLERERARGVIIRSKAQWVEEGEKNTSYFLRLEKHNYCNKLITKLKVGENLITDPIQILDEGQNFYQNLYSENVGHDESHMREIGNTFTNTDSLPKINAIQQEHCERLMTENDLLKSLKAFKNGKTPGTDGLNAEFYKFFWHDIKQFLLASINYSLEHGTLSIAQRRAIISLLPKGDKDRLYLKNWRPISLLNVDYKILAKALANRLIEFLPQLIDEDQTGYVKKRFIGNNIRIIEDIMIYTTKNKISGILLSVDFEKAFDSVSWKFLAKCLEAFNFGPKFRSYVQTLYHDISATVLNNGHTSQWFRLERGVRQGCPLSPYLFILLAETLSCKIRENEAIKGILLNDCEIKITQMADDTTCFVKDKISLKNLIDVFKNFEICSGLKINLDKTKAKALGPEPEPSDKPFSLDWVSDPIHTLGVTLSGNQEDHYILNFKKRLKNMKNLLSTWKCRSLSIKGKITVINTLAISPLLYLANVIYVPPQVIAEVKDIIVDFLWDGKPPKIAYNVLIQSIKKGGVKLIDFESKVKALKIGYVKRLLDNSLGKWKSAAAYFYKTNNIKMYFQSNHAAYKEINHKFYSDIHNFWSELQTIENPTNIVIQNQTIWNNRYITIENVPYEWASWQTKGIQYVSDILNAKGDFLSHNEISEKFGVRCHFLQALQIRQSLPLEWRRVIRTEYSHKPVREPFIHFNGTLLPLNKCTTRFIYECYAQTKYVTPTSVLKWKTLHEDFDMSEEEWTDVFLRPYICLRETKLQSFQYKIIHRIINCNKKLFDMRIKNSPLCTYCDQTDDIGHFFFLCKDVYEFWREICTWWNTLDYDGVDFPAYPNVKTIIFGSQDVTEGVAVLNFCIFHIKYYIYRQRLFHDNVFRLHEIQNVIVAKLEIEKNICQKENRNHKFDKFEILYENLKR